MPIVILSKNAEKEFAHLSNKDKKKIVKKLNTLQNESLAGKLLAGKLRGLFSLRAWPYRIIYELRKPNKVIVHHLLHRQKAYK